MSIIRFSPNARKKEMKLECKSIEAIEEEISRKSKMNPEMVTYILTRETAA